MRLSDQNDTQTDTANYVPPGAATPPTEGDWVLSELWGGPCVCEDEPPNISVCHEQKCEGRDESASANSKELSRGGLGVKLRFGLASSCACANSLMLTSY